MLHLKGPAKDVKSALCVLIPPHLCGPIQKIRADHDRSFMRWMPHVNLIFPFIPDEADNFERIAERLTVALQNFEPFTVRWTRQDVNYFPQSKRCTVHLRVTSEDDKLQQLRKIVFSEFPIRDERRKDDSFTPHCTIGQCSKKDLNNRLSEWRNCFKPASFSLTNIALISRSGDEPFSVKHLIEFGVDPNFEEQKQSLSSNPSPQKNGNSSKTRTKDLTKQILTTYKSSRPSPEILGLRKNALDSLSEYAETLNSWRAKEKAIGQLSEFGSSAFGLDTDGSDLDVVILTSRPTFKDSVAILYEFKKAIASSETDEKIEELSQFTVIRSAFNKRTTNFARLCLRYSPTNSHSSDVGSTPPLSVDIDLTVGNTSDRTLLDRPKHLRAICESDRRIKPYLYFVKNWAKSNDICDSVKGTINGYGWAYIGIFCLRQEYGAELKIPKSHSVGEMASYFISHLNVLIEQRKTLAADVQTGQFVQNDKKYSLYVKDPHDPSKNLARCVRESTVHHIQNAVGILWTTHCEEDNPSSTDDSKTEIDLSDGYPRDWKRVNAPDDARPIFRVLQFNTLADSLAEGSENKSDGGDSKLAEGSELDGEAKPKKSYIFRCENQHVEWAHRQALLLNLITKHKPDIICLQEVDHFDDYFDPQLSKLGYQGTFLKKRTTVARNPKDGCAIFFLSSKFTLIQQTKFPLSKLKTTVHNALLLLLKDIAKNHEFFVCCTHLKAGRNQSDENKRKKQTRQMLESLEKLCSGKELIICVDLNAAPVDRPDSKALVYPDIIDHDLGLRSVYSGADPSKEPSYTTWPGWTDRENKVTIDYIFHTKDVQIIQVLKVPEEHLITPPTRLPNQYHPSDHMPLVADIQFGKIETTFNVVRATTQSKLRPSWDVYKRLMWDPDMGLDLRDVSIRINDSRRGNRDIPFLEFRTIDEGGDIPFHHVIAFKTSSQLLWERESRLDFIFGSGIPPAE